MKSMENVIQSGMLASIVTMTISGGYNYNWTSTQQEDLSKVTFPHANLYLMPQEDTMDGISFPNMNAFRNKQSYELRCFNKLETESATSSFEIDSTLNYMLHDIKKWVGSNPVPDYIEMIEYIRSVRKPLNGTSDIMLPKYLIVTLNVYYNQDRKYPDVIAC